MAKKKSAAKKNKGSFGLQLMLVVGLLGSILFIPTTILLVIGMLPTLVAMLVDRGGGTRAITVGSLNLCGCIPFLLDLWTTSHDVSFAVGLVTDPRTIIVMYSAAGIGYMVDWALSGMIATIMIQRATMRLSAIRVRQDEMIDRWGREVTGELLLDSEGFPPDDLAPPGKSAK